MNDKQQTQQENYSRDADQTRYIWIIGGISCLTLILLFALELFFIFSDAESALIFTPEIVHTLIPVTIGGLSAVGGFIFGKGVGERNAKQGGKQ